MDLLLITFRYKDYRHGAQQKTMTLEAAQFIRRFLLHVLPDGFQLLLFDGSVPKAACRGTQTLNRIVPEEIGNFSLVPGINSEVFRYSYNGANGPDSGFLWS